MGLVTSLPWGASDSTMLVSMTFDTSNELLGISRSQVIVSKDPRRSVCCLRSVLCSMFLPSFARATSADTCTSERVILGRKHVQTSDASNTIWHKRVDASTEHVFVRGAPLAALVPLIPPRFQTVEVLRASWSQNYLLEEYLVSVFCFMWSRTTAKTEQHCSWAFKAVLVRGQQ